MIGRHRVLDVIYLLGHGWSIRVAGTKEVVADELPDQEYAIQLAKEEAQRLLMRDEFRTVEVRIKTKWLKRIRDSRTYPRNLDPRETVG